MTYPLTDRDRELLSELLDGRLSVQEKETLEQRIATSTELAAEWEQLQHLRELMKMLPRHKVRRSYLLKPGSVPSRKPSPFLFPMRLVSGLASAALVILLALDAALVFSGGMRVAAPAVASLAASEALSEEKASSAELNDEIIFWVTPTMEAFGKGGGAPDPSMDANSGMMAVPAAPQVEPPLSAESPVAESQDSNAPPLGLPGEATSEVPAEDGPILGIPGREEQGRILDTGSEVAPTPVVFNQIFLPAAKILFLLIAIGAAIAAVILGRRK
jgi:hypothetical protein